MEKETKEVESLKINGIDFYQLMLKSVLSKNKAHNISVDDFFYYNKKGKLFFLKSNTKFNSFIKKTKYTKEYNVHTEKLTVFFRGFKIITKSIETSRFKIEKKQEKGVDLSAIREKEEIIYKYPWTKNIMNYIFFPQLMKKNLDEETLFVSFLEEIAKRQK